MYVFGRPQSLQFGAFLFVTECQNEMAQKPHNSLPSLKYAQKEGNEIKKGPLEKLQEKSGSREKVRKTAPHTDGH